MIWHASIYDPVRDRMVLFGGLDGYLKQSELWELSLAGNPEWHRLQASGAAPPPVINQGAVYDPVRDRMLVLGGSTSGGATPLYSNQLWALSLAGDPEWSLIATNGVPPEPRTCRQVAYDSIADRILLYGGTTAAGTQNDLWSLSLVGTPTWSRITPAGTPPAARSQPSVVFDASRNRVLLFGGRAGAAYLAETWELALTGSPEWRLLSPGGTPPPGRDGQSAFYDPAGDRMIMLNGSTVVDGDPVGLQDCWSLSLGQEPAWSPLPATGAAHPGGTGGSVAYDSKRQRALFFGGWLGNTSGVSQAVWSLALGASPAWSKITEPQGPKATGRRGHSAVFDPLRHRMIVFGGFVNWVGEPSPYLNDLWSLDLDPPYAWTPLQATGTPPSVRWGHTAVYDPVRDRMIVFGGAGAARLGDLWELTLSPTPAWHPLTASGIPPAARTQHSAIYDPVGDRMLVFGGITVTYSADLWELSLASTPAWRLVPGVGPEPRAGHTAIYDPAGARMIIFGGYDGGPRQDLWQLELAGTPHWAPLASEGTAPAGRQYHTAVYDSRRQRMLVLGGLGSNSLIFDDFFELSLTANPQWRQLAPSDAPLRQFGLSAIYDPARDGMWSYAGTGAGNNAARVYWSTGGPTTPVWVDDFTLEPDGAGVAIRWQAAGPARVEDFQVTASSGGAVWPVPIAVGDGYSFVARDPSPPATAGDDIRYTLAWLDADRGWVVLVQKTWERGSGMERTLLRAPRPNPARGGVEIPLVLGRTQPVQVTITDVAGRVVHELYAGPMPRGTTRLTWSGTDAAARRAPSGVYFVRLVTASGTQTRKLVLAH